MGHGNGFEKAIPWCPYSTVTTGFNLGQKGQGSQAKIPQFFNFVGSNAGNNASPVSVGFETAVDKTTVAVTPSMRTKSVPNITPEIQCEKGWYISPLMAKKR